jgi:hypothetical protein
MLRTLIVAVTGVIFLFLSALHIYWACGGRWGSQVTVPYKGNRPLFTPSAQATVIVALLLLMAAAILLLRIAIPSNMTLEFITRCGAWVLTAVFVLRATGDFHWIGFFKTVRDTGFARLDTWLYSPLCLLLALGSAVAARAVISR